jgi:rhodanese-related sulfurtransferase
MNAVVQAVLIAGAAAVAAGGTWLVKGPPVRAFFCDSATLKPGEICLEQVPGTEGVVWVDARSRKDWEAHGVPGSILWNLDPTEDMQAFEAGAALRIAEGATMVVVYCGDENCGISKQVAERIRALDLGPEVKVLRGGWRALNDAGRVKGSNPAP